MRPPDRVIAAIGERREAIIDVIRRARTRIVLSLFRCNDDVIFDELAAATKRGVAVDALITSRAKGGKKSSASCGPRSEAPAAASNRIPEPSARTTPSTS